MKAHKNRLYACLCLCGGGLVCACGPGPSAASVAAGYASPYRATASASGAITPPYIDDNATMRAICEKGRNGVISAAEAAYAVDYIRSSRLSARDSRMSASAIYEQNRGIDTAISLAPGSGALYRRQNTSRAAQMNQSAAHQDAVANQLEAWLHYMRNSGRIR